MHSTVVFYSLYEHVLDTVYYVHVHIIDTCYDVEYTCTLYILQNVVADEYMQLPLDLLPKLHLLHVQCSLCLL